MLYWLFTAALIVLIGAVFENIDRVYGIGLRKRFFSLTHSPDAKVGQVSGFIAGQDAKARFYAALGIFVAWLVLKFFVAGSVSVVDIEWALLVVPMLMLGFVAGPVVGKFWGRRDDFFKAVDNPEAALKGAKGWLASFFDRYLGGGPKASPAAPAQEPAKEARPETDSTVRMRSASEAKQGQKKPAADKNRRGDIDRFTAGRK